MRRAVRQLGEKLSFLHQKCVVERTAALSRELSSAAPDSVLVAEPRHDVGSRPAARLRKAGRVPGILFSLPGEEAVNVSFNKKDIVAWLKHVGPAGWSCQRFDVTINPDSGATEPLTFPALGRQVHINAATDEIENVTLIHCPSERKVRVKVPLKVYGEETSPGLKAGGRINFIARSIPCVSSGDDVPQSFEVNVSTLEVNDKLSYADLSIPQGVALAVKDINLPILKIMKK